MHVQRPGVDRGDTQRGAREGEDAPKEPLDALPEKWV